MNAANARDVLFVVFGLSANFCWNSEDMSAVLMPMVMRSVMKFLSSSQ